MIDTDPQYWFLDEPKHTEGNDVVALVDGAAYMKHLYDRFTEMRPGDSLFYTAWRASPQQALRPDLSSRDTRLQSLLIDLVQRGVVVRLLAWYVPMSAAATPRIEWPKLLQHNRENIQIVQTVRSSIARQGKPAGSAYLDERLPSKVASHHQKSVVLTAAGKPWAYLGGIDLSVDRWDTPDHVSPSERQKEILDAWHDVQCVIQGPAVGDIAANFTERWNERKPPLRSDGDLPEPIRTPLRVPPASAGTLMVQRLRTLACNRLYDFRQRGEQTARAGINKAVDRARHFVYIEDQYFWPCTTVGRLAAAIARGVHVFLVLAKEYDLPEPFATAHYQMRQNALNTLRAAGAERLVCCHLEQLKSARQIYVHSKFAIVDDRFVTIGSANIGLRSHTTDSELSVAILDSKWVDGVMNGAAVRVCEFARDLRLRVWNEHLNVAQSALNDPIAAKAKWPAQREGSSKVHHAAYHSGKAPPSRITLKDWFRLIKALQALVRDSQPWPNVTSTETDLIDAASLVFDKVGAADTDLGDLGLGPVWWAPGIGLKYRMIKFLQDRLMNVETTCG